MFTINIYLRFALIALTIIGGTVLWATAGVGYGLPFILVGIVLLVGYFLLGTIVSTNMLLSEQKFDEAEKRLKLTFFPKLLLTGYRGVFHMVEGAIQMQRRDFNAAEVTIKKALSAGLPSDNERGAAIMQLMMIAANKNNRQAATNYFADLKKLNITEPMLKEQIKDLEKQFKMMNQNVNPSTLAMMGGKGFRPGGKRRMPKMR